MKAKVVEVIKAKPRPVTPERIETVSCLDCKHWADCEKVTLNMKICKDFEGWDD